MADVQVELILSKLVEIISNVIKSNADIIDQIRRTKEKIPDEKLLEEIRDSLGKSDKSLVTLINELRETLKLQDTNAELLTIKDNLNTAVTFIGGIKKLFWTIQGIIISSSLFLNIILNWDKITTLFK